MSDTNTTQPTQKIAIVGTLSATRGVRDIVEREIDVTQVRASFEQFLQSLKEIIDVGVPQVGAFKLDEVTFSAEITANGDFKLLGAGVGFEAKGGVIFTLRLKEPNRPE